jgi:hypothetical protein
MAVMPAKFTFRPVLITPVKIRPLAQLRIRLWVYIGFCSREGTSKLGEKLRLVYSLDTDCSKIVKGKTMRHKRKAYRFLPSALKPASVGIKLCIHSSCSMARTGV